MSLSPDHWSSHGKDSYTGMTAHWIDDQFEFQKLGLGCWLHKSDSGLQTFQGGFIEELFNKCKIPTEHIVSVMSDTTSNMKKFGTLLEKLDIPHIYCTDHVLQITANNSYIDS